MMPQDGSLLTDEQLMSMPLMMPMMMDSNGMLNMASMSSMSNMPNIPQNGMTKGVLHSSLVCNQVSRLTRSFR